MATPEPEDIPIEVAGASVRLRFGLATGENGATRDPAATWELSSPPDWELLEGIRFVSAMFEDGTTLGVAAIRPRGAGGHGDDAVAARLVDAEGVKVSTSDALVSVEFDAARRPRRLGIELWPDPDSAPLRVAADRTGEPAAAEDRDVVAMSFRLDGVPGTGTYETLRRR